MFRKCSTRMFVHREKTKCFKNKKPFLKHAIIPHVHKILVKCMGCANRKKWSNGMAYHKGCSAHQSPHAFRNTMGGRRGDKKIQSCFSEHLD